MNEYVIQQDQDKELVFYWYQARGRIIASEYSGKFWMVADAITRNRTDGALVRLVTPMSDGENQAHDRLVRFTQDVFPYLDRVNTELNVSGGIRVKATRNRLTGQIAADFRSAVAFFMRSESGESQGQVRLCGPRLHEKGPIQGCGNRIS